MSYETGTATDLEDFLAKLDTFATGLTSPWSSIYSPNPDTTNFQFELNKGSISFSSKYLATVPDDDDPISIHHATGSTSSGDAPGAHTADSGNGFNSGTNNKANFESERCVRNVGNGPFISYHLFTDGTSDDYIHAVLQISSGVFRHFGFGTLDKFGDNWVGGEYVYGHYHDTATNATPINTNHNTLLDGLGASTAQAARAATIRITSGLPNQSPAVWGVAASVLSANIGTDTATNVRRQIHGTFRAGMEPRGFANPTGGASFGVVPMYSIGAYYRDPSNDRVYLLGYMLDVRALDITNFSAEQEITIGSDTWIIFPMSRKSSAAIASRSVNSGFAYKKIV